MKVGAVTWHRRVESIPWEKTYDFMLRPERVYSMPGTAHKFLCDAPG